MNPRKRIAIVTDEPYEAQIVSYVLNTRAHAICQIFTDISEVQPCVWERAVDGIMVFCNSSDFGVIAAARASVERLRTISTVPVTLYVTCCVGRDVMTKPGLWVDFVRGVRARRVLETAEVA